MQNTDFFNADTVLEKKSAKTQLALVFQQKKNYFLGF